MNISENIFKNKLPNAQKLIDYGFQSIGDDYTYTKTLSESGLELTVTVSSRLSVKTTVIDPATNEPYTLHLSDSAAGTFVGSVKNEYEQILSDIADKCFEPDIFKEDTTKALIAYVREKYGDELEYLWQKFPDNAVWRRKDNRKWYAAVLTVSKRKLGKESDERLEIIDLRIMPDEIEALIDNEKYFPGYHMNKKHWYTIILDGSVPYEEICGRIDKSYLLAKKK